MAVDCRLVYLDKTLRLSPLSPQSSTWEGLAKEISETLDEKRDVVRLEYTSLEDDEKFGVSNSSSLLDVIALFRDTYESRKQATIKDLVEKARNLLGEGQDASAALMLEELMQQRDELAEAARLELLGIMTEILKNDKAPRGIVERAALASIFGDFLKDDFVNLVIRTLFLRCGGKDEEELSEISGLILEAVASTPSSRILVQPDCLPSLIERILRTTQAHEPTPCVAAEVGMTALTAALFPPDDLERKDIHLSLVAPRTISLLTQLLRSRKSSWQLRRSAASILAAIARSALDTDSEEERLLLPSAKCLFSPSSRDDDDDDDDESDAGSKNQICGDKNGDANNFEIALGSEHWKGMFRRPEVLQSALEMVRVASQEIECNIALEDVGKSMSGKKRQFANVVMNRMAMAAQKLSSQRQNASSSRNKTALSTLEMSSHLAWLASCCLKGDELWVAETGIMKTLLELSLYPPSPPELRCVALHSTATLEHMCRHTRFAKALSKEKNIVNAIRTLLERDALPEVQSWSLSILQALVVASSEVREELVLTNFRSLLATRMLQRSRHVDHASFMSIGAHMLASLTQLTLSLVMPPASLSPVSEAKEVDTSERLQRRKLLVRSTIVGMSTYTQSIVTLLRDGPAVSLRYTAVHLWLLSRIPHMREDLVKQKIVPILVSRIDILVRILCEPGFLLPRMDAAEKDDQLRKGIVRGLDSTSRVHTLNQLVATLWVLLQSDHARDECTKVVCPDVMVKQIVELKDRSCATARRLLMCCLWQLAHFDPGLQRDLINTPVSDGVSLCEEKADVVGTEELQSTVTHHTMTSSDDKLVLLAKRISEAKRPSEKKTCTRRESEAAAKLRQSRGSTFHDFLGHVGGCLNQCIEVRLVACQFFYYLVEVEYGTDEAVLEESIRQTTLMLAIKLFEVHGNHSAHELGALLTAKEASRSASRKVAFAKAGIIQKLVAALRHATSSRRSPTATAILHALFIISIHPANQVQTIRCGFPILLAHSRGPLAGTQATAFATRILENCRHHAAVASTYYKCELRLKAGQLRQEMAAVHDAHSSVRGTVLENSTIDESSLLPASLGESSRHSGSKLARLKQRFESFLEDVDEECSVGAATKETSIRLAAGTRVEAKSMLRLNMSLSRSVADVWKKSRPASGMPETPNFSPRTTWSPRITSYSELRPSAQLLTAAVKSSEIAPGQLVSAPRRPIGRKRRPKIRVSIEGGRRFTFHRSIDETLALLEKNRFESDDVMVKFPRVEGSRVSDGLFETFELPDGTSSYYYYRGRTHGHVDNQVSVFSEPLKPGEDLRCVLGEAHVPGGPKPPELPRDSWPTLFFVDAETGKQLPPPLPEPCLGGERFGDIPVKNEIVLELLPINFVARAGELKEEQESLIWRLEDSTVWITRGPDMAPPGSSRDFVHNQRFWARCVNHDWAELMKRTRFVEKLKRVDADLDAIKSTLAKRAELTTNIFHYFSTLYGSNSHSMSETGFKEFVEAAGIVGGRENCNSNTASMILVEVGASDNHRQRSNNVTQVTRSEFLMVLVLLAMAKNGSGSGEKVAESLQRLLDENVAKKLGETEPSTTYNPDTFRNNSIYNEDVERALSPHLTILQEIYKAYNPTTTIKRRMNVSDMLKLFGDAGFFDEEFTRNEAKLTFVFSQMKTAEWTRHASNYSSLSFADFLEALCRVSIVKRWPNEKAASCLPVDRVIDLYDTLEESCVDPKRAVWLEKRNPTPYHDTTTWSAQQNVAVRIPKLLFTLYRRLAASSNKPLHLSRCLRTGISRAAGQLSLKFP